MPEKKIQSLKGMPDILPDDTGRWRQLETQVQNILSRYGYREIRLPLLEKTELFIRSIGEQTDIVGKEMYSFEDRNGSSVTLRPEGTAGCVRSVIQHSLIYNQVQKLWYTGPMFRHERPQAGRQRQFHQIGVEVFGLAGADSDAELIAMSQRLWNELGITDVCLEINSLGSSQARAAYREILVRYFSDHERDLDEDSQKRLHTNPLRILDSKNPNMQTLIKAAPSFHDHLDAASADHFAQLRAYLDSLGIEYIVNPRLVRGLDYYSQTVFEWVTHQLGAQGTVCAGGRYDGLMSHFTGDATPAIGFAIGIERILGLLEKSGAAFSPTQPHAYLLMSGDSVSQHGLRLAEQLRSDIPGLELISHLGGGSFKSQFKKADKSKATLALVLGEQEIENQTITIKFLRDDRPQLALDWAGLSQNLRDLLAL